MLPEIVGFGAGRARRRQFQEDGQSARLRDLISSSASAPGGTQLARLAEMIRRSPRTRGRLAAWLAAAAAVSALAFPQIARAQPTKLYYAEFSAGTISVANADGSSPVLLVTSLGQVDSLALDPSGGRLYWTSSSLNVIQRSNLDGSAVQTVLSGLPSPRALAVNLAAGKLYWTEQVSNLVRSANTDGTNAQTLASENNPQGVAVDVAGAHLFWSGNVAGVIRRSGLDGSNPQVIVTQSGVAGLAVDAAASKLYFTECTTNSVRRANFDGSGLEILVTGQQECVARVAVDSAGGMFYFSDDGAGTIARARINPLGAPQTVLNGLNGPLGIAVLSSSAPVPALDGRWSVLLATLLLMAAGPGLALYRKRGRFPR
jgi:DNA-binding beta-propeller fold protein YncE